MGWLSNMFGKKEGGEGGGDRGVLRLQKKLMNKYVNTTERKRVIHTLADMKSDEAIFALLGRFSYVTDGSIVDEDEKELVYEIIRSKGEAAAPALEHFVKAEMAIYWPLRAYTELRGEPAAVHLLFAALDTIEDRWERSMERMNSLVSSLRDYHLPEVLEKLIELSTDDSEEIRFLAVDGLSTFDDYQDAIDAVVDRLLDVEETHRVKTFIMDLLIDRKWTVKRYRKELSGKIPEGYFVDDTGVVQRRF